MQMTDSWNYVYDSDPTLGNGYVFVIEQIWREVRRAITSVVPEVNLANIILDYAEIDDFYVFSRVLAIHIPGAATLTNWVHTYNIYLGLTQLGRHGLGYIHLFRTTNGSRRLEAKENRFDIDLYDMFQLVKTRDYMGIAEYMKYMLYRSYRPNLDKLGSVAATCAGVMESHAKFMLWRLTIKKPKKETILPEMDSELDAQFWSLFEKRRII